MFSLSRYIWIIIQDQTNQKVFDLKKKKILNYGVITKGLRLEKLEGVKKILSQTGESNVNTVSMQTEDAAVDWAVNHEDVYRNTCYIHQLLLSIREKNTFLILVLFLPSPRRLFR